MTAAPAAPGLPGRAGRRRLLPVLLSLLIVAWQFGFSTASHESRRPWLMTASMGLSLDAMRYFYFFDHFGVFPVGAAEVSTLGPTKQDAERFVAEHGDRLKMDFGWPTNTPRFGDYGKLFLFYPDVFLHHDPAHPSAIPANELLFVAALLAVFWAFWLEGRGLLGMLIVVLVGSDPFQVVETYARGNVFSIPMSIALLALAAQLRLLGGRKGADALAWVIAIAAGMVLACVREVRTEAAVIAVSVGATFLVTRAPWVKRVLLLAAFLLAFTLTGRAWTRCWADSFARAEAFVARAGGEVFRLESGTHHAFWHAIDCGLGDYGANRGFSWDDRAAFRWATTRSADNPVPIPYHYTSGYYLDETYDGVHHVAPTDLPAYNLLVRGRVLGEIRRDPAWYAGVLLQRLLAIQRDATPASLSIGPLTLGVPGTGWLTLPVLLLALWRRRSFHARIILFMLPTSAVALMVYSGRGMTYYGIAHLVALAVAIDLLVRFVRARAGAAVARPAGH